MKYAKRLLMVILICSGITVLTAFMVHFRPDMEGVSGSTRVYSGFAVLELFTSEGCSSCPPADELMAKIENEYKGQPVYLLAFHVDYWDRLGWKDVFSNPDYSNRQKEYGNWFNLSSIYTPQLVVNGRSEFVGTDEDKIRKAIRESLASDNKTLLSVQADHAEDKLIISYEVTGIPSSSRLLLVTLQKSAKTKVERGENEGRLLSHVDVVRNLLIEPLSREGKGKFHIPSREFNSGEFEIVAMVQDLQAGAILAATKVQFPIK